MRTGNLLARLRQKDNLNTKKSETNLSNIVRKKDMRNQKTNIKLEIILPSV